MVKGERLNIMDLIQKIHRYIDTRMILSKPEKEAVKKFVDKDVKYGKVKMEYDILEAYVQGYATALIMDRLFALQTTE